MKLNIKNLKKRNIHIIGISGLEGWAMLDFFLTLGFENITAHDFIEDSEFKQNFLKNHPGFSQKEIKTSFLKLLKYKKKIKIFFKKDYLRGIKKADFIFVPQSWFLYRENRPLSKLKNKIPFLGIINIYFIFVPSRIIGITGSQGKTTTSRLVYHIFSTAAKTYSRSAETLYKGGKQAKKNTFYGGNDKKAVQCLSKIPEMKKNDFLVLEVSHRQLMNIKNSYYILKNPPKTPFIAVILNINKNHLDEVKNFKEYQKLKKRILFFQGKRDFAILNFDDLAIKKFSKSVKGRLLFFSKKKELADGVFLDPKDDFLKIKTKGRKIKIIQKEKLSLQAKHHLENILAAIAVSFLSKIRPEVIRTGIKSFSWPKNCFEYLERFKEIKYYNNLASTTPNATEAAIKTLISNRKNQNLVLITGGEDKGMNYRSLVKSIKKSVKFLILFPDSVSKKIKRLFTQKERESIKEVKNLKEAVKIAKEKVKTGDTILLSPSGAFFQSKYGRRRNFLKLLNH